MPRPSEILAAIERATIAPEVSRERWLAELDGLVRLLGKSGAGPEGLTYGTLGGIQYVLNRLQESFKCRPLSDLEDCYAEDQLSSYHTSQEALDRTAQYFGCPGMELQVDKIRVTPDLTYYRLTVASDYTAPNRPRIAAGTILGSVDREFPPLSQVHSRF